MTSFCDSANESSTYHKSYKVKKTGNLISRFFFLLNASWLSSAWSTSPLALNDVILCHSSQTVDWNQFRWGHGYSDHLAPTGPPRHWPLMTSFGDSVNETAEIQGTFPFKRLCHPTPSIYMDDLYGRNQGNEDISVSRTSDTTWAIRNVWKNFTKNQTEVVHFTSMLQPRNLKIGKTLREIWCSTRLDLYCASE